MSYSRTSNQQKQDVSKWFHKDGYFRSIYESFNFGAMGKNCSGVMEIKYDRTEM